MRRVVVVFILVLAGALAGAPRTVVQAAPAAPATDAGSLRADFNHDGFADLAVGVPQDRPGGLFRAGAVNVLYGSASGLSGSGSQYFTQNTPGVGSSPETPDTFGSALAAGDFDHDGFADLAVGAPGEGVGDITFAGAVNVLYGSASGLSGSGSQYFTQNTPGVASSAEERDFFGAELTAGDFDDDGAADLAVGAPNEDLGGIVDAGAVNVLYGSAGGLTGTGSQLLNQDTSGVGSSAEDGDLFGAALTAGDFDDDGAADLAVGAPGEDVNGRLDAGAVNLLYGSAGGLSGSGSQYFTQNTPGVASSAENNDRLGFSLAAGDFNHDGFADLAVGAPFEGLGSIIDAGAVILLYGSADGLSSASGPLLTQNTPGVGSTAEEFDDFGFALTTGDFDQDGFADLAVGVRDEFGAGAVNVLYGSADGLSGSGSQYFTQNTPGVGSSAEIFDAFGAALAGGDFNNDGASDLAVGAPREDLGGIANAGAVNVLYGSAGGLSGTGSQFFTQETPGVGGNAEGNDLFGFALAAAGA
jgi:hypothetical protein